MIDTQQTFNRIHFDLLLSSFKISEFHFKNNRLRKC